MSRDKSHPHCPGLVTLVGAGPGDPGLLTLKGLAALREADFVLYDGLVNPLLLRHTPARTERSNRARTAEGGRLDQEAINAKLIAEAQLGKRVVRLKGGDPYIFGRGSEEATALEAAGIPFEVVPGVTAATAAGVYGGFSLTHRDMASAVAFVTGHEDPTKTANALNYDVLAGFPGTLVFYMGLHRLPIISEALVRSGKPNETPVAVISRASRPEQRVVSGTLTTIADIVSDAGLRAPSLIIVGECVTQRERIDWFERLPLFGVSVGITRPDAQADTEIEKAYAMGAEPVLLPTIEISPPEDWSDVDAALNRLPEFDWLVFTSANGVRSVFDRLWERGQDVRAVAGLRIACIGPATAETLANYHLRADLVPESYRSEALAEALVPFTVGKRVLWAGANRGRDVLPDTLTAAGATIEKVAVYRNTDREQFTADEQEKLGTGAVDWVGLSSPSIARNFARLLPNDLRDRLATGPPPFRFASISPVTTAAAREQGLTISAEATEYTWDGIFAAIAEWVATERT